MALKTKNWRSRGTRPKTVQLEEVQEPSSQRVGLGRRNEHLALELRLLRFTVPAEVEQYRVQCIEIHTSVIPAPIEVSGHVLRRDKAAIDIGTPASRRLESAQRTQQAGQNSAPPFVAAEALYQLRPLRQMNAGRQLKLAVFTKARLEMRNHNTII